MKYEHTTPALKEFGWSSTERQLQTTVAIVAFKCLNDLVPPYQSDKFIIFARKSISGILITRQNNELNVLFYRTKIA